MNINVGLRARAGPIIQRRQAEARGPRARPAEGAEKGCSGVSLPLGVAGKIFDFASFFVGTCFEAPAQRRKVAQQPARRSQAGSDNAGKGG